MKFITTLLLFFLPGLYVFAQTKNIIAFQTGISNTSDYTTGYFPDNSQQDYYRIKAGALYQLSYSRAITSVFSLEGAVIFSHNVAQTTGNYYGMNTVLQNAAVNIISIPVFAKFTFAKYVFIYGGPCWDEQTNYNSNDLFFEQSGLGVEAGAGFKYNFRNIVLILDGFVKYHGTLSLGTNSNNILVNEGVKFGIGYTF